jgi:hypothetical protein
MRCMLGFDVLFKNFLFLNHLDELPCQSSSINED